jgi:hypothetical protein
VEALVWKGLDKVLEIKEGTSWIKTLNGSKQDKGDEMITAAVKKFFDSPHFICSKYTTLKAIAGEFKILEYEDSQIGEFFVFNIKCQWAPSGRVRIKVDKSFFGDTYVKCQEIKFTGRFIIKFNPLKGMCAMGKIEHALLTIKPTELILTHKSTSEGLKSPLVNAQTEIDEHFTKYKNKYLNKEIAMPVGW